MQKWEYKATDTLSEEELRELGSQGWELIAVTHTDGGSPRYFYFKRPKS
jgi:hypothetical protein